jgi:tungstate transport system permease protein
MPISVLLSTKKFFGKNLIILFINSLMALPPVVVGLVLYLLISARGPLAAYELLYTPGAMVIAQFIILTPIIMSLSTQTISDTNKQYNEFLNSLGLSIIQKIKTLLWESRMSLIINAITGLGRGLSEVGAVIIVGGNIAHQTRVMTTTIAMETSRGDLKLALSVGIILIILSIIINLLLSLLCQKTGLRISGNS